MKIMIIGTTSYLDKMKQYKFEMELLQGNKVRIPALDSRPDLNELGICLNNLDGIKWADEIHVFWDKRSQGTIFDFGMAFALNKPLKIIYLEPKTFVNLMKQYEFASIKG